MNRTPVDSNNLASVGYDPASHTLEIEFKGGQVYRYAGVAEHVYDGLIQAGSPGRYFAANVKDNYQAERVG